MSVGMFEGEKSPLIKAQIVLENFILSAIELAPIILLPFVWASIVVFFKGAKRAFFSELLFFGFAGSAAAYLNVLSKGSILENLVPSFVVAITFLFQLAGLSGRTLKKPLSTPTILLSGTGAAICFVFSSRYLSLLF